jgi:hypothetical protein
VSKNADGTLQLLFNPATIKYDPPRPVWADGVDPLFEIDIEYQAEAKAVGVLMYWMFSKIHVYC